MSNHPAERSLTALVAALIAELQPGGRPPLLASYHPAELARVRQLESTTRPRVTGLLRERVAMGQWPAMSDEERTLMGVRLAWAFQAMELLELLTHLHPPGNDLTSFVLETSWEHWGAEQWAASLQGLEDAYLAGMKAVSG